MAGVFIEVDTQQLARDIEALRGQLGQAQDALNRVYEGMNELDAMWDGPANDAFKQQFASDRQHFVEACQEVQALAEALDKARSEYDRCEGQVHDVISALWL